MKNKLPIGTMFLFVVLLTATNIVNAQQKCGDIKEGLLFCTTQRTISVSSDKDVRIRVSIQNLTDETKMLEIFRPEQHYDVRVFDSDGNVLPTIIENKQKASGGMILKEYVESLPLSHGMGEEPVGPLKKVTTDLNLSKRYTFVKGTYRVEISRRIRTKSLGRIEISLGSIIVRVK